jgi:hypothetical protein
LDCLDTNRESVKISLSIYGADLFENRTYVSAGIKIMDMREVHPVTNQPLFFINEDINVEKIVKIQSSEICCILVIADARDKKSCTKKYSKNFMNGGKELVQKNLLASNGNPALRPFFVTHTTDQKASWHHSTRGGGRKNIFSAIFVLVQKSV